jgi:hypothetical protein
MNEIYFYNKLSTHCMLANIENRYHTQVLKRLSDTLNAHAKLSFAGICNGCDEIVEITPPTYTYAATTNTNSILHNGVTFDIGLYHNYTLVFGIMLQDVNPVNIRRTAQIPWIQLNVTDTLKLLPDSIKVDLTSSVSVGINVGLTNSVSVGINVGLTNSVSDVGLTSSVSDVDASSETIKLFTCYISCSKCTHSHTRTCCINCTDANVCTTLKSQATSLGCYRPCSFYPTPAHNLVDIAHVGYYVATTQQWVEHGNPAANWILFTETHRCIRCHCSYPVNKLNPYCRLCLGTITTSCEHTVRVVSDDEYRDFLRDKLSWLAKISISSPSNFKCQLCNGTNVPYTYWFGTNRACCEKCLHARCVGDGLI